MYATAAPTEAQKKKAERLLFKLVKTRKVKRDPGDRTTPTRYRAASTASALDAQLDGVDETPQTSLDGGWIPLDAQGSAPGPPPIGGPGTPTVHPLRGDEVAAEEGIVGALAFALDADEITAADVPADVLTWDLRGAT